MQPAARVGLLVVGVDKDAVHDHIGTTVFNNFSTPKQLPWDLGDRLREAFAGATKSAGYELVNLSTADVSPSAANTVIGRPSGAWEVPAASKATYELLRNDLKLDALVVVSGGPTLVVNECTSFGCSPRIISKSGLLTRSFLGMDTYYAVPSFQTRVFSLQPVAELTGYQPISSAVNPQAKMLIDQKKPKEVKGMTEQEFGYVVEWIDEYVQRLAKTTVSVLATGVSIAK